MTVKVSPAEQDGLRRSFETANGACDWISEQAWHHQTFRPLALDKLVYSQVRQRFGLSAQECGLSPERDAVQNRRVRFASGGFQPQSQALAFRRGWFTALQST